MKKYKHLQYKNYCIRIFSKYIFILCLFGIMDIDIFPQFLVKVYKIWLWLNPKRELNKNGGSIPQLWRASAGRRARDSTAPIHLSPPSIDLSRRFLGLPWQPIVPTAVKNHSARAPTRMMQQRRKTKQNWLEACGSRWNWLLLAASSKHRRIIWWFRCSRELFLIHLVTPRFRKKVTSSELGQMCTFSHEFLQRLIHVFMNIFICEI
jgi:hypothetical protein